MPSNSTTPAAPVVIIGAGAAGCAAARILARRQIPTLLLEAGPAELPAALRVGNHLSSVEVDDWWWEGGPPRGRGLGGSTAVNGMVLQGIDPRDARRWGWDDAADLQSDLRDAYPTIEEAPANPPGPFTTAMSALVERGFPGGPATSASGGLGWLPLALALDANGQRLTAADALLPDVADPNAAFLTIRTDSAVERLVERSDNSIEVHLESGEVIEARHVAVACGATNSPSLLLRSGLVSDTNISDALNHWSTAVIAELDEPLQVAPGEAGIPSSRLLRCQTALTENYRVDLQMLVLDHTGGSKEGRRHGVILVTALEKERLLVLEAGIRQALYWLRELDGVRSVSISKDRTPVQHQCGTLRDVVESASHGLAGHPSLSVIDASAFPELPHTNPMLTTMVGAAHWATHWNAAV